MIEWFARNPVAANLLMVTIIIVGVLSAWRAIPLEVFPSFELDQVHVTTAFRGATPKSVEDGITNRIEEAIYTVEGVGKLTSASSEGLSSILAEIDEGYDKRVILNNIKLKVDSLNTLPSNAENSIVSLVARNQGVIQVVVAGDVDQKTLRLTADKVRTELLAKAEITLVELLGVSDYEISVEISPTTLESYGLTLSEVAAAINDGSADISAGNLRTLSGDILVRTNGQAFNQNEFSTIPIITSSGADPILLGDIATIVDGFEDQPLESIFNGKPAVMMNVTRTGQQSSIQIAKVVRDYISDYNNNNSASEIKLDYWDDDSKVVKARLSTLINSGIYGSILVLLVLSLFLRPAVAFWVFLGVPVSFMGAFIFMPFVGGTFNIMSLFAFITVLGIVVDDAIVTGENIYRKTREGMEPLQASIVGTKEIALPVTFGILTTVVAFLPMTDLGNTRIGYIAIQIPLVVIPVLLMSLVESKLVLPSHLSHVKPRSELAKANFLSRLQLKVSRGFESSILRYYQPFLKKCLSNKVVSIATLLAVSSTIAAFAYNGHVRYTFFPRVEAERITATLAMPDTTGYEVTRGHLVKIANHVRDLQEEYRDPNTGISVIRHTFVTSGSSGSEIKPSVGQVLVELIGPEERHIPIRASQITNELKRRVGDIPGSESLGYVFELGRAGVPINVELSGGSIEQMSNIGTRLRERLKIFPNVFDIQDNFSGGKEELNISLNERATALGLNLAEIATQVRGAVFGIEAQRIQRGREEARVMVRLPKENRSSLEDLENLNIRSNQSNNRIPLSDVAIITPKISPTTLHRLNRKAILSVTADVDKQNADVPAIMRDIRQFLNQELASEPSINYEFKGEAEEQAKSNEGFKTGGILVLIAIYALLAIPFKSYGQPLIVMSIIPFSAIGAVLGHIITGSDISILSLVGLMALLGVVINDSLVLVDYINRARARGAQVYEAVLESGAARFRPVMLTSITTFAGLTPLLLDNSTQSEFLKPMAISLGFGILFATVITLIIVPINYLVAYQVKYGTKRYVSNAWSMWLEFWNKEDDRPKAR